MLGESPEERENLASETADSRSRTEESENSVRENVESSLVLLRSDSEQDIKRLNLSCLENWNWSYRFKANEAEIVKPHCCTVLFHQSWSNGTAAVRASRPLIGHWNYWEIHVGNRVFGTSMMFGIVTDKARLTSDSFVDLIGEDSNGWGLSHSGYAHHGGQGVKFCRAFEEHTAVTVGILVDLDQGEITYFKNGKSLGVAFDNINVKNREIYPAVSSTAAKTTMSLGRRLRAFVDLKDRCRYTIVQAMNESKSYLSLSVKVQSLKIPSRVKDYILEQWKIS